MMNMHQRFAHLHAHTLPWHRLVLELGFAVGLVLFVLVPSASAAMRLQERSLYMNSVEANATTFYKLSFRYMSPDPVGSFELLFCEDPIPYHPCDIPPGLDASNVVLSQHTGETGFAITQRSTNRLVMSRDAVAPTSTVASSYYLDDIVNPRNPDRAFAIRIKTFSSTNATGPQVDFGSVRGQVAEGVIIQTQVPPMLIFCLAQQVGQDCSSTNDVYFSDLGELSSEQTLTAQSEMAVGTNASGGFAIFAHGTPLSAGTNIIQSPTEPTPSQPGTNQFGINLTANTAPLVGNDPIGPWTNAVASSDYGQPDHYKFVSGDVIAYSPNVSLMRKFTVSYIVNTSPSLRPGVYSTTVNFIAAGRF